MLSNHCKHWS